MVFTHSDLDWFFRPHGSEKVTRYPLTNLGVDDKDVLHIDLAVAGFKKDEVQIELRGNQMHITGSKPTYNEESKIRYIQKHVSSSNFSRVIVLHENYIGGEISASMEDGILHVEVEPKEPQKKLISIG